MTLNEIFTLVSLAGGFIVGCVFWSLWAAWWLSKQFSTQRTYFFSKLEKVEENIISKLEYHERHDDQRFASITNDILTIKVRNAIRDGEISEDRKKSFDQETTTSVRRTTET